jgi:hypothetical protein
MLVWEFNQRIVGLRDRQEFERLQTAKIQHAIFKGAVKKPPSVYELAGIEKPDRTDRMSKEEVEKDVKRKLKAYQKANGNSS